MSTGNAPVTDFQAPAGLDEGHQLALVVLGAARDDDLAPVGMVGDHRLERRTIPEIERIDRLHIVMAVEQHMRTRLAVSAIGFWPRSPGGPRSVAPRR